jgi:hypothetical protein
MGGVRGIVPGRGAEGIRAGRESWPAAPELR